MAVGKVASYARDERMRRKKMAGFSAEMNGVHYMAFKPGSTEISKAQAHVRATDGYLNSDVTLATCPLPSPSHLWPRRSHSLSLSSRELPIAGQYRGSLCRIDTHQLP
jgi:hypothetical protein